MNLHFSSFLMHTSWIFRPIVSMSLYKYFLRFYNIIDSSLNYSFIYRIKREKNFIINDPRTRKFAGVLKSVRVLKMISMTEALGQPWFPYGSTSRAA